MSNAIDSGEIPYHRAKNAAEMRRKVVIIEFFARIDDFLVIKVDILPLNDFALFLSKLFNIRRLVVRSSIGLFNLTFKSS
jgi:hypothetical protein